jgi:hypothetical protein
MNAIRKRRPGADRGSVDQLMRIYSTKYLFLALIVWSASCAPQPPKPSLDVPVSVDVDGLYTTQVFRIDEHNIYRFSMRFKFTSVNQKTRIESALDMNPLVNSITVAKRNADGAWDEYYETIAKSRQISWGSDFIKTRIGHCDLTVGVYRIIFKGSPLPSGIDATGTFLAIEENSFKTLFNAKDLDRSKSCPR